MAEEARRLDEAKLKQLVAEKWRAGGENTLIKAMPRGQAPDLRLPSGCCTTIKYLVGRTPEEMEPILGFRRGSKLAGGADIYRIDPLPSAEQFELAGYTHLPGGKPQLNGRQEHPDYPPGSGAPQWVLSGYPQSGLRWLATVRPGERFACRYDSLPTGLCAFLPARGDRGDR